MSSDHTCVIKKGLACAVCMSMAESCMAAAKSRNQGRLGKAIEPSAFTIDGNVPQMLMLRQLMHCRSLPGHLSDPGAPDTRTPSVDPIGKSKKSALWKTEVSLSN